jgi:hypothetical protein
MVRRKYAVTRSLCNHVYICDQDALEVRGMGEAARDCNAVTSGSPLAAIGTPETRSAIGHLAEMKAQMRRHRLWWALNDPVACVWLCRAERRGAVVPWTE